MSEKQIVIMYRQLKPNTLFIPTKPFYWRQINRSNYHAKAFAIETLKNCHNSISTASTHTLILKLGLINDTFTANHLLNSYVRARKIDRAQQLFDETPKRNVVTWTSLMAGYVDTGRPDMAVQMYFKMGRPSVWPNEFTVATAVNACSVMANVKNGKIIHTHVEVLGLNHNLVVCSSLVDMYGKCNEVDDARRVFDSMVHKNVVSWTSMVTVYAQNAQGYEALELFRKFSSTMFGSLNHFMLASVINACGSLGKLGSGKAAHGAVIRRGHGSNDVIASALVDMYAKGGLFSYCEKVFQRMKNPSVIPYTSIIVGAAKFGLGVLSIKLFEEMNDRGIKPNDVTFLGVLYACSHSGLVKEGLRYLDLMHPKYEIVPGAKHYNCVVDMLGRTGRLDEAFHLAKSIQVRPDEGAILWGTLLSTSRLHGRVDIALEASKWLIESNQQLASTYVTMSNAYALARAWENVHNLRVQMKHNQVHKEPGCSWIEVKEITYVFHAGDLFCHKHTEVVSLLRKLEKKMKEKGYTGKTIVSIDVEEEAREEIVGLHSERLALGFALITMPKGLTIRIMKNLRMCQDCHEAFKLTSGIVEREIIVRDINRFHHFKNGCCTCRDFW